MRYLNKVGLAVITLVAMLVATPASADADRVPICHLDEQGVFTLLNVSARGNAVNAHLGHGDGVPGDPVPTMAGFSFDDGCVPVADGPSILAVAYINLNGIDGYQPDGGDVMITQFEDVDNSETPTAGDIIRTNRYPVDIDGTSIDPFPIQEHIITEVVEFPGTQLGGFAPADLLSFEVITTTSEVSFSEQFFAWAATPTTELYLESRQFGPGAFGSSFRDSIDGSQPDVASFQILSPSFGLDAVNQSDSFAVRTGDDPFVDVDVFAGNGS